MASRKLPFLQFYVDAWLSDQGLRTCSLAARGLWIDLLCLMHKGSRRGYLIQENGQPLASEHIARACGCSPAEAAHLLQELSTSGVTSASEDGVIFCRRMVRDAHIQQQRSNAGKMSAKARGFVRTNGHQKVSGPPNAPLISNSSSFVESQEEEIKNGIGDGGVGEGDFVRTKTQPNADPAISLAQEFAFLSTKRRGGGVPFYAHNGDGCVEEIRELMRHGVTAEEIRAEIVRKERFRGEWCSDMAKRLLSGRTSAAPPPRNGRPGKLSAAELHDDLMRKIAAQGPKGLPT